MLNDLHHMLSVSKFVQGGWLPLCVQIGSQSSQDSLISYTFWFPLFVLLWLIVDSLFYDLLAVNLFILTQLFCT